MDGTHHCVRSGRFARTMSLWTWLASQMTTQRPFANGRARRLTSGDCRRLRGTVDGTGAVGHDPRRKRDRPHGTVERNGHTCRARSSRQVMCVVRRVMAMSVLDPTLCELRSGLVLFEVIVVDCGDHRHMPRHGTCVQRGCWKRREQNSDDRREDRDYSLPFASKSSEHRCQTMCGCPTRRNRMASNHALIIPHVADEHKRGSPLRSVFPVGDGVPAGTA